LGLTPLDIAVIYNNPEMVHILTNYGARVLEGNGPQILNYAVGNDNLKIINILAANRASFSGNDGSKALTRAVVNDNLEMVDKLVNLGASFSGGGGLEALTHALENNNLEIFKNLLRLEVSISDDNKLKFLTHAVETQNLEMVNFLIENLEITNIANLEKNKKDRDLTLLHKASLLGSLDICQQLIMAGADINATAIWQNMIDVHNEDFIFLEKATPLQLAIIGKNDLIVRDLLDKNALLMTNFVMRKNSLLNPIVPNLLFMFEEKSEIYKMIDHAIVKQQIDSLSSCQENPAPIIESSRGGGSNLVETMRVLRR
jgi:ankyrin repeat protein